MCVSSRAEKQSLGSEGIESVSGHSHWLNPFHTGTHFLTSSIFPVMSPSSFHFLHSTAWISHPATLSDQTQPANVYFGSHNWICSHVQYFSAAPSQILLFYRTLFWNRHIASSKLYICTIQQITVLGEILLREHKSSPLDIPLNQTVTK